MSDNKKIVDTVVQDIYNMLDTVISGTGVDIEDELYEELGRTIVDSLKQQLTPRTRGRKDRTLYFSEMGKPCMRSLWYDLHGYEKEKLLPSNLIKFIYGDILESFLIFLAKASGHKVTDEQKTCILPFPNDWEVRGRMDCKIDGMVVDVKSASSYAFKKFEEGSLPENDSFGYLGQLGGYAVHEETIHEGAAFFAIDKQNGTLVLYKPSEDEMLNGMPDPHEIVEAMENEEPPARTYVDKPYGKSGNRCLGIECSYCNFKNECWKESNKGTGLRTFVYSGKPVFFTQVSREPKVNEVCYDE